MKHLKQVNATYRSHLKFAWGEAIRCVFMSIILFIHGLIPYLFPNRFSKFILVAQKRIDKFQGTTSSAWGDSSTTSSFEE